ncbi:MAG TPA: hypothetical protein VEV43_09430 [Actinomycetota bacterium]|nr:hypothetical protein [Actinomycetota bacterium]
MTGYRLSFARRDLAIVLILAIGVALRFWVSTLGSNFDLESYGIVAEIVDRGGNVYAETERYNYGPIWFFVLGVLHDLGGLFSDPVGAFRILIIAVLTLADVGIWAVLHRRYGRIAGFLFFLNPISIIITGYHNQFDNLAVLVGLLAMVVYAASFLPALLLLGLSLTVKHVLLVLPLWLAIREKGLRRKLLAVAVPLSVLAVSFVPFLAGGRSGIVSNVALYRGHDNAPFWHGVLPAQLQPLISPIVLFGVVVLVLGFVWRREEPLDLALLYLVTIVVFAPSIANQYLAIVVPALAAFPSPLFLPYQVLAAWMLAIHPDGLHNAWLRDRSPGQLVAEQSWPRTYDPLIMALSLGLAGLLFPALHSLPRRAWEWTSREAKAQWRLLRGHDA